MESLVGRKTNAKASRFMEWVSSAPGRGGFPVVALVLTMAAQALGEVAIHQTHSHLEKVSIKENVQTYSCVRFFRSELSCRGSGTFIGLALLACPKLRTATSTQLWTVFLVSQFLVRETGVQLRRVRNGGLVKAIKLSWGVGSSKAQFTSVAHFSTLIHVNFSSNENIVSIEPMVKKSCPATPHPPQAGVGAVTVI